MRHPRQRSTSTRLALKRGDKVEVRWPHYDPNEWAPATFSRAQVLSGTTYYLVEEYASYFPRTAIRAQRDQD